MNAPNLFEFAPSELSQDAFICWSLDWGRQDENLKMQAYGLSFLNAMLEKHQAEVDDLERLKILAVDNQVNSIDVLVQFTIDQQPFELIIEDKTGTRMHSDQLQRYFTERSEKGAEKTILVIYYKTGYIFDDENERLAELNRYHGPPHIVEIFDKADILEFMDQYTEQIDSDIFQDYYQHIQEKYQREQEVLANIHSSDFEKVKASLRTQKGQVKAMKSIFGDVILNRGTNNDGRPWVHFAFNKDDSEPTFPEVLFYRVDRRSQGYYISLKQYRHLPTHAKQENRRYQNLLNEKKNRLCKLFKIFNETMTEMERECPNQYIESGKRSNRGKNESEVGVFFFSEENSVERFKEFFNAFHPRFCEKVKRDFAINIECWKALGEVTRSDLLEV